MVAVDEVHARLPCVLREVLAPDLRSTDGRCGSIGARDRNKVGVESDMQIGVWVVYRSSKESGVEAGTRDGSWPRVHC